jgi:hypothetical protein
VQEATVPTRNKQAMRRMMGIVDEDPL